MFSLRIEHVAIDYDAWKRAFDGDPLDRKGSGVQSFLVMRTVDDPTYVMIDLDFDTREAAEKMHTALQQLWEGPAAAAIRDPRARLVEIVETAEL